MDVTSLASEAGASEAAGMIAVIAALVTAAVMGWAWQNERRLLRAPSPDAENLVTRLARVEAAGRAPMAVTHAVVGSWERRVADAASLPERMERRDALSDAVDEIASTLAGGADWPNALLRIQALTAGFLTMLAVVTQTTLEAGLAFAFGVFGLVVCAGRRQRAIQISKRQRELADRMIRLVDPDEPEALGARTGRRAPQWTKK